MTYPLTLLDVFLRGLAVGGLAVLSLSSLRSGVGRDQRAAILLTSVSVISWVITESPTTGAAFGYLWPMVTVACGVGGFFWLMVLTIFEDRPVTPLLLAPALIQMALGGASHWLRSPLSDACWWTLNLIAAAVSLHACVIIARGWNGDLMEGRRQLRGILLGAAAIFALTNVLFAFVARFDPAGPWMLFSGGRLYGGGFLSLLVVATVGMFVQLRQTAFGPSRRNATGPDPRAEAAERAMLAKLNEFMAAGGWRQEGLTIGELARQLEAQEHRVRRLINQRLGFRNFADFVHSYRIEAAKRRLADPTEAQTTVAAIAFDLGYGSLGPFNRAFRAATGSTPTEWRRQALQSSPDLQEAV